MAISNGLLPLTSTQLTFAPLWSKTCALQHWLLMMAWVRAVRPSLSTSSRRDPELIRVWMQEVWPPAELSIRHDLPPESLTASDTPCCMRNSTTSLWPEEHAACSAAERSALLFSLLSMNLRQLMSATLAAAPKQSKPEISLNFSNLVHEIIGLRHWREVQFELDEVG